jgi:hypothetical protein
MMLHYENNIQICTILRQKGDTIAKVLKTLLVRDYHHGMLYFTV